MLQYPRFPYDVFTDTLINGTVSKRGNKYSQVFGTSFGWTRSYPMANKCQAHEAVSLLFKRDGVPPPWYLMARKSKLLRRNLGISYVTPAVTISNFRLTLPIVTLLKWTFVSWSMDHLEKWSRSNSRRNSGTIDLNLYHWFVPTLHMTISLLMGKSLKHWWRRLVLTSAI